MVSGKRRDVQENVLFGSDDAAFTDSDIKNIAAQASEDLGMKHVPTVELNPTVPAEIQPSTRFLYLPVQALHELPDFLQYSDRVRHYADVAHGYPLTQKQLVSLFLKSMLQEQYMMRVNFPGSQTTEALSIDEIVKGLPADKKDREVAVALAREILKYVAMVRNNAELGNGQFADLNNWRLEEHIDFVNQRHKQHSPAWLAYVAALEKLVGNNWSRGHNYYGQEERSAASYLLRDDDLPAMLRRGGELHELFDGDLTDLAEQIGPVDYAEFSGSSKFVKSNAQAGRDVVATLFGRNRYNPQAMIDAVGAYLYLDGQEGLKWMYRIRADEEPRVSIGDIPFHVEEVKIGTAPWMPGDAIAGRKGLRLPDSIIPSGLKPWTARKNVYVPGQEPVPYLILSIDSRDTWKPMEAMEEDRGFYDRSIVLALKLAQDTIRRGGKVVVGDAETFDMQEVENALMNSDPRYTAQAINQLAQRIPRANGIPFVAYITSSLPDQRRELGQLKVSKPGLPAVFYETSGRAFMDRSIAQRLKKKMGFYDMSAMQNPAYNLSVTNR